MITKIVRCRGIVPAVYQEESLVDYLTGKPYTHQRLVRPALKCVQEAKFIESPGEECERPTCDDCSNMFARLVYIDETALSKYGV